MNKLYKNIYIELFKKFKNCSPASIREFSVLNKNLNKLVKEIYPEIYKEKFYILILKSDDEKLCNKYWHLFDKSKICKKSAKYGALNCLKYAKENNCPWDKDTCTYAAEYGHLDCLKYAKENNCPSNKYTCSLTGRFASNCIFQTIQSSIFCRVFTDFTFIKNIPIFFTQFFIIRF